MDFRNTKRISVNGKSASKVYVDSKLVWQKEKHISVIHIDFDSITKLTDNVGYIYYGPKGATDDPSEMSLSYFKSKSSEIGYYEGSYVTLDLNFDSSKVEKVSNPEYEGRIPFTIDTPLHTDDAPPAYSNYRGVYPDVEWTLTATYNELKDTKVIDCKPTWKPETIWLGMSPDHLDESSVWDDFTVYMFVLPVGSVVGTPILSSFTTDNWEPFYHSVQPPYVEYKQEPSTFADTLSATIGVRGVNSTGFDTIYWNTDGLSAQYLFWCIGPKPEPSIDLNGEWVESTYSKPSDCPEGYDMYMSNSNYHVADGVATMYINFDAGQSGDYTIYISSYGEPYCDYTKAYDLDGYSISEETLDNELDPVDSMDAWKAVTYTIPHDDNPQQIKIEYVKDGSGNENYDRGFVLIPTPN